MNEYFIGAGALLTAGPNASIAGVSLHAQTDAALAPRVRAAVVDFESRDAAELSRVLVLGAGWNAARARTAVIDPLLARGACSLGELLVLLARAAETPELHLFARWLPGEALVAELAAVGVALVAHPLESIRQAALVTGTRYLRAA